MATPRRPQEPRKSNTLAVIFAIGILGGAIWLIMLIFGLGPYAIEPVRTTRTLTPTDILISGVTQAPAGLITSTPTLTPTFAPEITPTATPSPTLALLPYILIGEPEYMSSALIRPSLGCDWLVIAGQVWNLQDAPVKGLSLHLFGELDGYAIDRLSLTGSAPDYGQSGYEFQLENLTVDSQDTLFIQLFDANGNAISHPYGLETFNDCQKNLILVNFKQVR